MKPFKFFQKEKKSMVTWPTDGITPGNIRYDSYSYSLSQVPPMPTDGEVLNFVNGYLISSRYDFDYTNNTSLTTPIASHNIINYEVSLTPHPTTSVNVESFPHNDPRVKIRYVVQNQGGDISVISDKRIELI
jgi:hypothetical protein